MINLKKKKKKKKNKIRQPFIAINSINILFSHCFDCCSHHSQVSNMSTGDVPHQVQLTSHYDSDDSSSSSKSLFNRSRILSKSPPQTNTEIISTLPNPLPSMIKVTNDEYSFTSKSQVCRLEQKLNANLDHQQSEFTKLHQIILDLSNQVYRLKSANNSRTHSPISNFRPNSGHNYLNIDYSGEYCTADSLRSPACLPESNPMVTSQLNQLNSSDYFDSSNTIEHFRHIQDVLSKTTAALERRDIENDSLKKQINELRSAQLLPGPTASHLSTPSSQHSHASAFVPIVPAAQPTAVITPKNAFNTTSMMPFTMSINNNLPSFSGQANEMPTKFITEFESRASGLFGYHDEYLLRAVHQVFSETALTWFVQQQQESSITTWSRFKQLFLQRFRTPDKVELFRGRLRTLWQGDTESTADYFEKLKALISEIEPVNSAEYLKRKFLQKLRKDIREKMLIGLTSSLQDLLQKAIEIETNLIQQKIDDKLRAAQQEDQQDKHKRPTVNHLSNIPKSNPSHLSFVNLNNSHDNNDHNQDSIRNRSSPRNKYSRTFINSTTSSPRQPQFPNPSRSTRTFADHNTKVKSNNNHRWCSFCSSTTHTWLYCYSNPQGLNYQPSHSQNATQWSAHQPMSSSYSSENSYSHQPPNDRQQQNRNEFIHGQHPNQHHQQPVPSSHVASQRVTMSENSQGSRY